MTCFDVFSTRLANKPPLSHAALAMTAALGMSTHAMLPNPTTPTNEPVAGQVVMQDTSTVASAQAQTSNKSAEDLTYVSSTTSTTIASSAISGGVSRTVLGSVSNTAQPLNTANTQQNGTQIQSAQTQTTQAVPVRVIQAQPTAQIIQAQTTQAPTQPVASHNQAAQTPANQPASSQDIATAIYAFVVRNQAGAETLEPVTPTTNLRSGDVVEYHGYFSNRSTDRLRSLTATMTIPDGMEFVGHATPAQALGSMDGSRFLRMPLRANINGQSQELPLAYYKALQWQFADIGLQGMAVVKYRAKLK